MEIILGWLGFAVVVALIASSKGRSGFAWFLVSLIFSPLVGGILVLVLPRVGLTAAPRDEVGQLITPETHVRCPECRELVRGDAHKCKHCGTALIPATS